VGYAEQTMRLRWVCVLVLGVVNALAQDETGRITGTVVDGGNFLMPNATVSIVSPTPVEIKTDGYGEFVITRLSPGVYKLRVQKPGFVVKDLDVSVEADREASLGHVVLDVKFAPCVGNLRRPRISEARLAASGKARVLGSARGETYGGLRYLTITLLATGTSTVIATTGTDKNGQFDFEDLNPGIYDVAVSIEASALTKLRNLRVRKGHELEVHLTWEQPPGKTCL
jgi:hypothetical protein